VLQNEGHLVFTAQTGKEALDEIEKSTFDLILLDYNLPVLNGREVLANLEKVNSQIPIFLISGLSGNIENEIEQYKLVKKVIGKPFNIQEICDEVNLILA